MVRDIHRSIYLSKFDTKVIKLRLRYKWLEVNKVEFKLPIKILLRDRINKDLSTKTSWNYIPDGVYSFAWPVKYNI